jgi:hypothetical protein
VSFTVDDRRTPVSCNEGRRRYVKSA